MQMSVADTIRTYLRSRPFTLMAIEGGIVNYSALSRTIQEELGLKSYAAVKAGVCRYASEVMARREATELRAHLIFEGNTITLMDGIVVITSRNRLDLKSEAEVKFGAYYAYLTDRKSAARITKNDRRGILKVRDSCTAIIVHSDERLETTVGALSLLTAMLAGQNINIIETISCYTETIFVVDNGDALRSYELLSALTK